MEEKWYSLQSLDQTEILGVKFEYVPCTCGTSNQLRITCIPGSCNTCVTDSMLSSTSTWSISMWHCSRCWHWNGTSRPRRENFGVRGNTANFHSNRFRKWGYLQRLNPLEQQDQGVGWVGYVPFRHAFDFFLQPQHFLWWESATKVINLELKNVVIPVCWLTNAREIKLITYIEENLEKSSSTIMFWDSFARMSVSAFSLSSFKPTCNKLLFYKIQSQESEHQYTLSASR